MFSERLKQLRKEAGLTQKQVADALQVAQNSYSNWEKGVRTPLNPTIDKLAELFNVSNEYLKGITNIRNPYEKSELEILINQLDDEQKEKAIRFLDNLIKEK